MSDRELPADYFAKMYAAQSDPWDFESRWYEQRKYALSVAMLPKPRYRRAFEPGCSIGVLTEKLSERCDSVLATDIVPTALESVERGLPDMTPNFGSGRWVTTGPTKPSTSSSSAKSATT